MSEVSLSVLAFSPFLPYPPDHGGRIRTFLLLRELARRGHDVHLVPLLGSAEERRHVAGLEEAGISVHPVVHPRRFGRLTLCDRGRKVGNYLRGRSDVLRRFWSEEALGVVAGLGRSFDVVLAEVLWSAPLARAVEGTVHVLDTHNVEHVIATRTAAQTSGALKRGLAALEARGLRHDEAALLRAFDGVVAVSEVDRESLLQLAPGITCDVVGNCVDTDQLQPLPAPGGGPPVCLFMGSANYPPNLDAAEFFATGVLPSLRRRFEGARMLMVGADPPPRLQELAAANPGVELLGYVDDIVEVYAESTVSVVPIRVGGGTRTKILEAMALKRPVVSTTVGAEGLSVEDQRHLLIADTAESMAEAVARLHTEAGLAERLSSEGRGFVEDFGSAASAGAAFEQVLRDAHARSARP